MEFIGKIPEEWNVDHDFQDQHHYVFNPLFTDYECDRIISIGEKLTKQVATIKNDESSKVDKDVRTSQVSWIPPSTETRWIYEWIWNSVRNTNGWNLDVRGFYESLQYTVYDATDGVAQYDWHTDTGPYMNYRKISLTVQLSDPDEYTGGIFELERGGMLNKPEHLKKGSAMMFPSILRHRVLPVTAGIRKSLVVWVSGPHIR